nr:hypothetical protein [Mesorhizobium sp. AD1-1]
MSVDVFIGLVADKPMSASRRLRLRLANMPPRPGHDSCGSTTA